MNIDTFWRLVEEAKSESGGDVDEQATLLEEVLTERSAEDIVAFDRLYDDFRHRAYRNELWAAGYIINGGCSDDGFEYFRGWLIAQGRQVYEGALADPESLADVVDGDEDCEGEAMLYVAMRAYEAKTGQEMPPRPRDYPSIQGEEWTEDDVMTRFPRLASACG